MNKRQGRHVGGFDLEFLTPTQQPSLLIVFPGGVFMQAKLTVLKYHSFITTVLTDSLTSNFEFPNESESPVFVLYC